MEEELEAKRRPGLLPHSTTLLYRNDPPRRCQGDLIPSAAFLGSPKSFRLGASLSPPAEVPFRGASGVSQLGVHWLTSFHVTEQNPPQRSSSLCPAQSDPQTDLEEGERGRWLPRISPPRSLNGPA